MIEFHNVTKRYPNGHNALKNANFNIHVTYVIRPRNTTKKNLIKSKDKRI